jgi:uncharacterized protein (DUF697 family)
MNRKKLPKAILRPHDEIPEELLGVGATEPAFNFAYSGGGQGGSAVSASQPSRTPGNVISLTPPGQPSAAGVDTFVPAPELAAPDLATARRRTRALAIVDRHAAYSGIGGLLAVPLVNAASVTAINLSMVKALSRHYSVPFERDRARAIVVAFIGGAVPTGLGAVTASTLFFIMPASALAGIAVSAVSAASCTRAIGRVFVEHFESGATLDDIR